MSRVLARALEHMSGLEPDGPPAPRSWQVKIDTMKAKCLREARLWAASMEANRIAVEAERRAAEKAAEEARKARRGLLLLFTGGSLHACRKPPARGMWQRFWSWLFGMEMA